MTGGERTMPGRLAVVTPIWEPCPSPASQALMRITDRHATAVPRVLVSPRGMSTDWYQASFPDWTIRPLDPAFFTSVEAYSAALLGPGFYESLVDFDAIVLCQLDAVLLKDPAPLASVDADFLGAPWEPPIRVIWWRHTWLHERRVYRMLGRRLRVGNGGLSLRRPSAFVEFTGRLSRRRDYEHLCMYNEDMVVSYFGARYGLRIGSVDQARNAFMEIGLRDMSQIPDVHGVHALERVNPTLFRQLVGDDAPEATGSP